MDIPLNGTQKMTNALLSKEYIMLNHGIIGD